jgi:hypothetical protein
MHCSCGKLCRRWSIKIQSFNSEEHFLEYAGRYVRRPTIAQRRISYIEGNLTNQNSAQNATTSLPQF